MPGTRSCKLLAQHPAMLTLLAACEQVQRRLFGEDLWRRFRIPPFLGRLLGRWEATMWRWRRGPANDRFQVQLGLQACSACRLQAGHAQMIAVPSTGLRQLQLASGSI